MLKRELTALSTQLIQAAHNRVEEKKNCFPTSLYGIYRCRGLNVALLALAVKQISLQQSTKRKWHLLGLQVLVEATVIGI